MRFSLATLVLLVLWIGALMAVWVRREPWTIKFLEDEKLAPYTEKLSSPDGTRCIGSEEGTDLFIGSWRSNGTLRILWRFQSKEWEFWHAEFNGDDTIIFGYRTVRPAPAPQQMFANRDPLFAGEMHRRFPEWWWGHFYRPEVWLAIGLSGLLIWRAARSHRAPVTQSTGLRIPAA